MPSDTTDALQILVRRSEAGDVRALAELTEGLAGLVPWAKMNQLARRARKAWADTETGKQSSRSDRLRAVNKAAARLARAGAGPLERLLAAGTALAEARLADLRYSAGLATSEQNRSTIVRDLAGRIKRAELDAAAANRVLRAFQQRINVGP